MSFDTARFLKLMRERGQGLGQPLEVTESTGSTNDDARTAGTAGAKHGSCFLTDYQSRGRGRRGRQWESAPAENLLCSILLRPQVTAEQLGCLSLLVGLSIRDALAPCVNVPLQIKWPNDVLAQGKKLCGILVESSFAGDQMGAVIAGFGINLHQTDFPSNIQGAPTSLVALGADPIDRETVLANVLLEVEARLTAFQQKGLSSALPDLRQHDALLGTTVRIEGLSGVADGINENGALLLRDSSGKQHAIVSGTVEYAEGSLDLPDGRDS
ncbi:MAG: biotin--[acetyl-CoA-carboxylase] ligase [Polyangiaceae bacterium]|nr:biotin--[acetyl-CoA-carboxylase] ligase [Polyangiaceae bacterium]